MTKDAIFRIYSMTKAVTSVAVLMLLGPEVLFGLTIAILLGTFVLSAGYADELRPVLDRAAERSGS